MAKTIIRLCKQVLTTTFPKKLSRLRLKIPASRTARCNPTPKLFIWWKSRQNLIKSGQNPLKSGQNLWEPSKTPWKSEQKWRPTYFDLKIMAHELTWRAFLEGHFCLIFRVCLGESGQNSFPNPSICLLLPLCSLNIIEKRLHEERIWRLLSHCVRICVSSFIRLRVR